MNTLLDFGRAFIKRMNLGDVALIKFCLCALGILIGTKISEKAKKPVFFTALAVFIGTYIPLIIKLIAVISMKNEEKMFIDSEEI